MKRYLTFLLNITLLWSGHDKGFSQTHVLTDCLSAFQVEVPTEMEAFQQLVPDTGDHYPVLKYLADDQFTYWYTIKANASDTLNFTVFPTHKNDQFQTVMYQYNDTSFCRDLVHGRVAEKSLIQSEVENAPFAEDSQVFTYQARVEKGQHYYLSVLSLDEDYCGHLLELNFRGTGIRLHAMNKPCFNLTALEFEPSVEEPLKTEKDIALDVLVEKDPVLRDKSENNDHVSEMEDKEEDQEAEEELSASQRREASLLPPGDENRQVESSRMIDMELNEGDKLDLENVFFYNNTYAFREDSENELKELLQLMEKYPDLKIEIGGHTAGNTKNIRPNPMLKNRGEAWNFKGSSKKLSKKRAEAVKTYLVDRGISARRIKTEGFGDSEKIIENPKTPDDHRRNMRVEIVIISAE